MKIIACYMNEVIQSRIDFSDFSTVGFKVLLDNFRAFKGDASNPFAVAPKAVQALVDNYDYSRANSGNIAAFISDYCKVGDDYEDIYSKYRIHYSQLAAPKMAHGAFNNALNERFCHKMRHGRHYYEQLAHGARIMRRI